jgi:hypothetical protein
MSSHNVAGARAKIHFAIVSALVPNGTFVTKCCGSSDASYAIARREQRFWAEFSQIQELAKVAGDSINHF